MIASNNDGTIRISSFLIFMLHNLNQRYHLFFRESG